MLCNVFFPFVGCPSLGWGGRNVQTHLQLPYKSSLAETLTQSRAEKFKELGGGATISHLPDQKITHILNLLKKRIEGTSLVVQWLRIGLPMQGTWVRSLGQENPTCRGATKPVHHNYWAHVPQLLKTMHLDPVLCNKRSHPNEKPAHRNEE